MNGKLYDANGHEFRVRGVNRTHWDNGSSGLPNTGANTERIIIDFNQPTATNVGIIQNQMINKGIVPMPGNWDGTCKNDPATAAGYLTAIVDTWVAQASIWTQFDHYSIINIANEWGPDNSTVWRDSYIDAIKRMRNAGYKGTLSITSGGCGQDPMDLINYAQAVFDSDPQKNVIFDLHIYGYYDDPPPNQWVRDFKPAMAQIAALPFPVVLGEFGPGRNVGPSPTMLKPEEVIATAETLGLGWLAWAWDDNNLPDCKADDNWFAMSNNCGSYQTDADLTQFGKIVVPLLQSTATPATIFK